MINVMAVGFFLTFALCDEAKTVVESFYRNFQYGRMKRKQFSQDQGDSGQVDI